MGLSCVCRAEKPLPCAWFDCCANCPYCGVSIPCDGFACGANCGEGVPPHGWVVACELNCPLYVDGVCVSGEDGGVDVCGVGGVCGAGGGCVEPVDVSPLSPPNKFCAKLITVGFVIIWKIAPVLSSLVAVGEDSFVTPSKIPRVSSFKKGAMSCILGPDLVLLDKSCHAKSSSIAVDQFNFRSFLQVLLMCNSKLYTREL